MAELSTSIDSEPAGGAPVPARRRRDQTGRDMLLSLAVLLIPILAIGAILRACGSADPTVIDPAPAIDTARSADLFPVLVPQGLGESWEPVQATFRRTDAGTAGTLRLGYLAPGGAQVLLIESNEEAGALLERELGSGRVESAVMVGGQAWTSSAVRGDELALVRTETVPSEGPSRTVRTLIVAGHAPLDTLTTLAASLR